MMNSTKDTSEAKVLPKEESNGLSIANSTLEATLSILNSYIYFKCKNSLEKVKCSSICYLEAAGSYCNIYLSNCKKITVFQSLREIISFLPQESFIRVHRSYIININCVDKYYKNSLYVNNVAIPIGRAYKKETLSHFNIASKTIP